MILTRLKQKERAAFRTGFHELVSFGRVQLHLAAATDICMNFPGGCMLSDNNTGETVDSIVKTAYCLI